MEKIQLEDEMGNVLEFELVDTFGMDDDNYAVLADEEGNAIILKIDDEKDSEIEFITIDDENELDDAIKVYQELKGENLN